MWNLWEGILHQLTHFWQGFIHPRWCRISSINSKVFVWHFSERSMWCWWRKHRAFKQKELLVKWYTPLARLQVRRHCFQHGRAVVKPVVSQLCRWQKLVWEHVLRSCGRRAIGQQWAICMKPRIDIPDLVSLGTLPCRLFWWIANGVRREVLPRQRSLQR